MKLDINIGSIWTMLVGTALAIVYMFNTFVTVSEFESLATDLQYDQYYDFLIKRENALADGNQVFAEEISRRMERLRAKICKVDPEWERCDGSTE